MSGCRRRSPGPAGEPAGRRSPRRRRTELAATVSARGKLWHRLATDKGQTMQDLSEEESKYTRIEHERRFLVSPRADWRSLVESYSKTFEDKGYPPGHAAPVENPHGLGHRTPPPQAEPEGRVGLGLLPDGQPYPAVAERHERLRQPRGIPAQEGPLLPQRSGPGVLDRRLRGASSKGSSSVRPRPDVSTS